jgi:chromosome segregation ATPase
MIISMKTLFGSVRPLTAAVLLSLAALLPGTPLVLAQTNTSAESLSAAQTRLRYAREEMDSAKSKLKREEKRLKDAEDSLARQQKKLEEEKAKVEQAKSDLAAAKTRAEQAEQKHDEASAEIRRFYQERQPAPTPTKPQ